MVKLYRIAKYDPHGVNEGFVWSSSLAEAISERDTLVTMGYPAGGLEIETVEITPTKAGLLAFARVYASEPTNG